VVRSIGESFAIGFWELQIDGSVAWLWRIGKADLGTIDRVLLFNHAETDFEGTPLSE